MSRRKQAKPRSFKPVEELIENLGTQSNNPQDGSMCEVEESMLISLTSPVNDDGSNTNVENLFSAPSPTHDSSESEAPGTDQGSSWRSETPEDPQTSPAPSSCATPNSATDLPDAELSYTVGITEATPYACQFCDKAFPRLSFLKKHEQIHGDHMPFRCEFCSRLFKHKRSRDRHIKLHTGDKKYRCNHCDAAFSRSDHLKIHMKTHDTQKPFQCTVCNRGYNTAAALTSHMQNHKRQRPETPSAVPGGGGASSSGRNTSNASEESIPSPSNYRCVHCDESFPKNDHLQNHILTVHSNELLSADDCIRSGVPVSLPDPRLPPMSAKLACIYCTKDSFTTMEQLQLHVQAMHSSILNGDLRDFSHSRDRQGTTPSPTNASGVSRQRNMSSMTYPCDMCTMRFSTQRRLKKHTMSIHRNYQSHGNLYLQTPLICLQCSLPFHTSAAFAEHYLLVHGSSSPSLITPVPEQVKPTDLSRKTPRSESEERKAKRLCTDDSLMRTELISPIATPQYEYPGMLLCNQCDAALPDFESFRTHLKTHLEQDGGAQRFLQAGGMNVMDTLSQDRMSLQSNSCICPHCGATFKDLTTCEQHVITHFLATTTEYGCQSCMKKFSKPDELQKHLMDIHAHHLYRCSLCKEMFDSKVAIQVHFSVNHMNECKMYQCTACPNATSLFHIEQEFGLHVRTIHGSQTLLSAMQAQSKNLYCMFCRQTFGSELELQFHLATHSKQFRCPICPEVFQIEFLLDRHIQTYHSHSRVSNGDNDNTDCDKSNKKSSSNSPLQVGKTHTPPGRSVQKSSSGENNNVKKQNDSELTNCDICERNDFSNETELVAHRKLVHHIRSNVKNGVVSLHCAYCNENCKTRTELENHMKSHSQSSGVTGKHKCNICDEICASAVLLAEHKLTHCKVISGNSCTQCKSVLTTEVQFYMHLVQHSTNNNGGNQKMKSQVALPTPCIICRQTLISDIEVRIHSQFHIRNTMQPAEYPCSRCLKNVDTQSIIFSDGHHLCPECYSMPGCTQPRTYHCAECQLTFETNGALEEHTEIVHVKKTYICIKCQASFDNERDVHVHVATHLMTEGSNHECHLCRRLLATPLKLQAHLIEHTFAGCGSFTCYLCSTVFTASQGLLSHMNEHGSAAKPYDCPQCNQKFFFRAELDNHTFSHLGRPSRSSTEVDIPLISPKHYFVTSSGIFDPLKNYDMSVYYIKESQKKKKGTATSPAYKCYNCNQEFTDANTLQSHRQHCTKNEPVETKNVPATIEKPKEEKEEQKKEEYIEIGSSVSSQRLKTEYQNTLEDGNSTFTSDN